MPTVAIASEFLDAFARIPRAQQRKVREFTEKFRSNPKGPGINYEKIHSIKDDKVRTVRIDQKYRAVILHPPEGDVYVLVWVDNHDEAMDWAGKRRFEVNPVTGSLQVFSVSDAEEAVAVQKKTKEPGLLDAYDDDVLLSFGVPQALLPAVIDRGVSGRRRLREPPWLLRSRRTQRATPRTPDTFCFGYSSSLSMQLFGPLCCR